MLMDPKKTTGQKIYVPFVLSAMKIDRQNIKTTCSHQSKKYFQEIKKIIPHKFDYRSKLVFTVLQVFPP